MDKELNKDVNDFKDTLIKEIINLEGVNGKNADVRRITLNEVVDHLQSLLDAEQYRDFKQNNVSKTKEKLEKLHNRVKKKSYADQRAEEIFNKFNITELMEDYYKLGLSSAYGYIMYMIDQDFDKRDIKKFIMDETKDDVQFRSDVFGVWGELMDKR